jgi:hypothetical protein
MISTHRLFPSLLVILVAFLAAAPTSAQVVRGRVVDASDRMVADALVELWAGFGRVGGMRTDDEGLFEISAALADERLTLTVRRIGLGTRTVHLASANTPLVVRMEVQAVALRPLAVASTARRMCPNREEPRARALWERMRGRYWQPGADSVFVFAFMEIRSGDGTREEAYRPDAGRVGTGWTNGALVEAHLAFMPRSGYATSATGGAGERTAHWDYRALDGGSMQDFTGEYFGAAHTFAILGTGAEGTTIGFCPRERMGMTGQIEGTLTIRADTTLEAARWRFRTPRPDEDAGGEASYEPPDPALGRALLARETVFWRKTTLGRYYFEAKAFTGWRTYDPRTGAPRPADGRP